MARSSRLVPSQDLIMTAANVFASAVDLFEGLAKGEETVAAVAGAIKKGKRRAKALKKAIKPKTKRMKLCPCASGARNGQCRNCRSAVSDICGCGSGRSFATCSCRLERSPG